MAKNLSSFPGPLHFITYEYNAKGWLTAIKDGGTNTIVSYDYDAAGRRTKRTLENSTFTIYDYDNADQLTSIWHKRASSGTTNTISRYQYGYDDAGNRTNMTYSGTGVSPVRSESYSYDAADQLTGATYSTNNLVVRTVFYSYDAAGNRTGMVEIAAATTNTTTYTANSDNQLTSRNTTVRPLTVTGNVNPGAASNKWYASTAATKGKTAAVSTNAGTFAISGVPVSDGANALTVTVTDVSGNIGTQIVSFTVAGTQSIGYDLNGNQTNENAWAFSYDRENRLVAATSVSSVVQYSYDALGRLIQRIAGNSTNRMYYAGWQLIAEYNGAGSLQRRYIYGPGIDELIRMTVGSTNYYSHVDGLGSVTEITDSAGAKSEGYTYDVYGAPTFYNGSGIATNGSTVGNRLLFTGRDRDPDTGWYNYRHRYYSPVLVHFAQPDPIGIESGTINLYRFCRNNPISFADPSGLLSCADLIALKNRLWDNYQGALNDLMDEELKLGTINNAELLQTDLIWGSTIMSGGATVLGGSSLLGFAGLGTSASVVGRGVVTISIPISSMGSQVIATGVGPTVQHSALMSTAVSGSLTVGRLGTHYLDHRLRLRAEAAQAAHDSAEAALESIKNLLRLVQQKLDACGCK
jgi:RHS repeat-associated protein